MGPVNPTELELFHDFVGSLISGGGANVSPETTVERFRRRQQELASLREKLGHALDQSASGQSAPFDAEETKAALREQLAARRGAGE